MIRDVLDTNQRVSMAIRPGGVADQIRRAWQERRFTLLTSPSLLAEFRRVLAYPKLRALIRLSREDAHLLSLHAHAGIPIITARHFLGILEKESYPEEC